MDSSCWTEVSLNKNMGWRWREGEIRLAGLTSLSRPDRWMEWSEESPQVSDDENLIRFKALSRLASHAN